VLGILVLIVVRKILFRDVVSKTKVNFMLELFVYNLANSHNKNKAGFKPLSFIQVITVKIKHLKK